MYRSFESSALEKVDLKKMHERANNVIESQRIKIKDFVEPYGEETIARDFTRVEELEKQFKESETPESKMLKEVADIWEAIILEHGELSNWFGENANTIKASRYDDYINGVDMIIEFQEQDSNSASFLGLAADVTFTSNTTNKFDRLRSQIEEGELAKVKYFHSEYMSIHGQLGKLPEVIVGVSKNTVMELAEAWLERENRALARHKVQIMILKQIKAQLETFDLYAESIGQKEVSSIYKQRLKLISKILEDKADIEKEVGTEIIDDPVYVEIMTFLKNWKKSLVDKRE